MLRYLLSRQFKENQNIIADRDREIESLSLEMAIGLSEVFEALKQISLGEPSVRISEFSEVELIAKLKQLTNITASKIGEGINQFHEFAIGIAEHFDVLNKVSRGQRDARISENSQDELLKVLGKVTNDMIESVSREISEREKAEELLERSEEKYRLLVENIPDVTWMADQRKKVLFISANVDKVFGYTPEEIYEADDNLWFGKIHSDNLDVVNKAFESLFTRGSVFDVEYRIQRKDGEWIWLRNRAATNLMKDGVIYAEGIARDITQRKHIEDELRLSNDKLQVWVNELEQRNREISLLGEMGNLLQTCLTAEEAYSIISKSMQQIFLTTPGALCIFSASRNIVETVAAWGDSLPWENVFAPEDCWALRRGQVHLVENSQIGLLCRHLEHTQPVSYMCIPMQAHGEMLGMLHLQTNLQIQTHPEGMKEYLTESKQQLAKTITEQIALALSNLELKEILRIQSIRDPLTGLFNRRYMEESLEREARRVIRKQNTLGVIMLDIDHFKHYNDTFGHAAGDTVLRELGIFLKTSIRTEDIACRYGGEEFTLILPEASLEITRARAEHLREGFKHMNVRHLGQASCPITISLGVAILPEHGSTGEAVLQAADAALYRAKAEGRDRVIIAGQGTELKNDLLNIL
jgi:diguanylate cyclase (GGDEF)-like protein/PAS domain S-box-containing protein